MMIDIRFLKSSNLAKASYFLRMKAAPPSSFVVAAWRVSATEWKALIKRH